DGAAGQGRVRWNSAASRQDVEVFLEVPLADRTDEALPFVSLVVQEDVQHLAGECATDDRVALQRLEGLTQRRRDACHLLAGLDGLVDVAVLGRSRVDALV